MTNNVLILVLVEYAPRGLRESPRKWDLCVLILVLVEYAPRVAEKEKVTPADMS